MRLFTMFCFGVSLLMLVGCTTTIKETHVFQSRDELGRISYYQVGISADAKIAKTDYKAGLFDAEALDAILSEVNESSLSSTEKDVEKLRSDAIIKLSKNYYDSVGVDQGKANSAKEALLTVLEPIKIRDKKYAIIYSAMASLVEEAMADFAEARETEDVVYSAVAGIKRDEYIESKVTQIDLDLVTAQASKTLADAKVLQPTCNANLVICGNSLRKMLEDAVAMKTY